MGNKIVKRLVVFSALIVYSCGVTEFRPSSQGDARINVYVTPDDTLFGLGLYAYTNGEFFSVSAYFAGDAESYYELESYNNSTYDYFYETPRNQMKSNPPASGEYFFDVEFKKGEFETISDILTTEYSFPPFITLCEYNTDIDQIVVRWAEKREDGLMKFNVYNSAHELLYSSSTVSKDASIHSMGYNKSTWLSDAAPMNGDQIIVEIIFYRFELINGGALNTQSAGVIQKTITWGG